MSTVGYNRNVSKEWSVDLAKKGGLAELFGANAFDQTSQAQTPQKTLLQTIFPKKSTTVNNVNTSSMSKEAAGASKEEIGRVKADITTSVRAAQAEALNAMYEEAEAMGLDPGAAMRTIAGDNLIGNVMMVADAATGCGITLGGAVLGALLDIKVEGSKLKPGEVQDLMEATARNLQHSAQKNQELVQVCSDGQSGGGSSGADFSEANADLVLDLLQTDINDLPEMKTLNDMEASIQKVMDGREYTNRFDELDGVGTEMLTEQIAQGSEDAKNTFTQIDLSFQGALDIVENSLDYLRVPVSSADIDGLTHHEDVDDALATLHREPVELLKKDYDQGGISLAKN